MRGEPARRIAKYIPKAILSSVASRYFRGVIEDRINATVNQATRWKMRTQDNERWNVSRTL